MVNLFENQDRPILTGRVEISKGEGFGSKILRALKFLGHTGLESLRYAAQVAPAFAEPSRPITLPSASSPTISLEESLARVPTLQSRRVSPLGRLVQSQELYTDLPKVYPSKTPRVSSDSRDLSQLSRGGAIEEMSIDPQAAWFSMLEASPDIPANYRNAMMRISRIVDPMGEAATAAALSGTGSIYGHPYFSGRDLAGSGNR